MNPQELRDATVYVYSNRSVSGEELLTISSVPGSDVNLDGVGRHRMTPEGARFIAQRLIDAADVADGVA